MFELLMPNSTKDQLHFKYFGKISSQYFLNLNSRAIIVIMGHPHGWNIERMCVGSLKDCSLFNGLVKIIIYIEAGELRARMSENIRYA